MARINRLQFVVAASFAALTLPKAGAQATDPAPTSPVLAPASPDRTPPPSASKRPRAISSEAAAALAAASPRFDQVPVKPAPKPEEEKPDLREVDKPKNGIVRLPKMVVREPKPPIFTERSISTKKGIEDIAMRRYISDQDRALNRFTLPLFGSSMEARAMEMYAEDERLKNMADLRDNAIDASRTNPAAGAYIRKEAEKTYLRSADFGWNGGGPK